MTQQIQPADPVARRRAVVLLVAVGIAGALLIGAAGHYRDGLRDWILADPQAAVGRIRMLLQVTIVLTVAPLIAFGVYALRLGRRVHRDDRFPPVGQRVVRATRIVGGAAAQAYATRLERIGAVSIGVGALLAIVLWLRIGGG